MTRGSLGTGKAKRTSKVQNNNIIEEDIIEEKRENAKKIMMWGIGRLKKLLTSKLLFYL